MAIAENDRAMQAKCLCCFADIHRRRNDIQVGNLPSYDLTWRRKKS